MDALLLIAATALVGKKYMDERKLKNQSENEAFSNDTIDSLKVEQSEQPQPELVPQPNDGPLGGPVPTNNNFFEQLGISHNTTSGGLPFAPDNVAVEVAQKKEREDTSYVDEMFFPQDTKNTGPSVQRKAWMLAEENAYPKPKTERLADSPTRADVNEIDYRQKIRDFGDLHTQNTLHISKTKNFQRPVEEIWTGNGSGEGPFHPSNMNQHHKFLLSDNPLLHLPNGPKGAFVGGALMSDKTDKTLSTFKQDKSTEISGIATGPYLKIPFQSSFKTDPSNAEGYLIEKQIESSVRAPVNKTSTNVSSSVTVAHDDKINSFDVKLFASRKAARSKREAFEASSSLKNAEIETPSVVGAAGGTRSLAVKKDSEIKTSEYSENLGVSASRVLSSVGAKSIKKDKSFVSKPLHEELETTFAETHTPDISKLRKTSEPQKKFVDTLQEITLENKGESINAKEFTSKNFVAPVDKNLPKYLQNKPTTSLSFAKNNDIQLKDSKGTVENFESRLGGSKLVTNTIKHKKSSIPTEVQASNNASLFSTLLMDRLGSASGGGRKMPFRRGAPTLRDAHFRANLEIENLN